MVLYPRGGTGLTDQLPDPSAMPKLGAWAWPKRIRWVVLYAPAPSLGGTTQTILVVLEGVNHAKEN